MLKNQTVTFIAHSKSEVVKFNSAGYHCGMPTFLMNSSWHLFRLNKQKVARNTLISIPLLLHPIDPYGQRMALSKNFYSIRESQIPLKLIQFVCKTTDNPFYCPMFLLQL